MKILHSRILRAFVIAAAPVLAVVANAASQSEKLVPIPAAKSPIATQSPVLGAAWAGDRLVSVGANGVVLLSDDGGASFHQAQQVPVSSVLTSVSFAGPRTGWAVGHWGVILATTDGGETWRIQRLSTEEDRPLFAVHFFDPQRGVAVGLWSLVLVTQDGGATWTEQRVNPKAGTKSDFNLLGLFPDGKGGIYATAEKGQVLHSVDYGRTWEYLDTGYNGSLWCGAMLDGGVLLVGGQRGTLMRSEDGGRSWTRIPLKAASSITSIAARNGDVMVVGLDGFAAQSHDGGRTFTESIRAGGAPLTAALPTGPGKWLMFSQRGVVQDPAAKPQNQN
ncbi:MULTISPECIES: WD40/YVTN/BNR-like repeat-containing protein [Ralstonia]|uniref:YCF48-related protein n=1 Tax=Ralstonia mojiangensis TaxID=2953895 RepID=A0AAE3LDM4_9RALS|nr:MULTISPECIES: YCF48-related protein [Ralstonia]MCT7319280.1 YCF48-related protein [Ralstonia mojiangensis]TXD60708.1 glycosyl hydrolase [Ralstonia sp. TCR112]